MKQKTSSYITIAFLCASIVPLSSCSEMSSWFSTPKPKIARHKQVAPKATYDAETYLTSLSLSRLSLATGDVTDYTSNINGYATQKKAKQEKLTVAIIEYKPTTESGMKETIAPVIKHKSDFTSLNTIMDKIVSGGTIHNIRLVSLPCSPQKSQQLPKDVTELPAALENQQQQLLASATPLNTEEDIKTQLSLIDFFTRHHFRDAAYISVENAKSMLAAASNNKSLSEPVLKQLSAELEQKEGALKTALPYTL